MKKIASLLLAVCMLFALAACGGTQEEPTSAQESAQEVKDWTRQGYFSDENENFLSVTWMDDVVEPGWYVGVMIGDIMTGWTIPQEGNTLHGDLNAGDESAEPLIVTVSEEGEDGLQLAIEGGEIYHFTPMEMLNATIFVTVNTEGQGNIDYAEGEEAPEIDPEFPYQSAQINLAEPATHTFVAWPDAGNVFVKWTKDGEDFSTEPQITVLLDESADFVAVFEEDPGWQNPVMNFVGEYQCDRAHALVECFGNEDAWITIQWGGSAWEMAQWDIVGRLDTETLTIEYSGCTKSIIVYDDNGDVVSQEPEYEDGTGTIVFNDDGSFTWHEDQSEYGNDMVFEWLPVTAGDGFGLANPWRDITEAEAKELCPVSFAVPEGAENVQWSVLDSVADPSGVPGALVQLLFDLGENSFTAREQITGDPEADIAGMYYDWTYEADETLSSWDGMTCHTCRFVGENEYADLCAWYDAGSGVSYSLGVAAADLDGFDLLAVADAMHG